VYPRDEVAGYIEEHFIPVKAHIAEQPGTFGRFHKNWTPTLVVMDGRGIERHEWVGYLPADEFSGQLALGRAQAAFGAGEWAEAEELFREAAAAWSGTEAAPEAVYWAGVSRYKASEDASALGETAERLEERYPDSLWATRASVWGD